MSSKLEGLRISAAEVFDTFSVFHAKQNWEDNILAMIEKPYVANSTIFGQKRWL